MTTTDPTPERETTDDDFLDPDDLDADVLHSQTLTMRSIRLAQPPAPTGWTPPQPLVVTDAQWRFNCLKARVDMCAGEPPAWLVTDKNPNRRIA